jgi:hypothetical protein
MKKTLTSVLVSLVIGLVWTSVQPFMGEVAPRSAGEYFFNGTVWMILAVPVIYCFLKNEDCGHPLLCSGLCAFLFALPFYYVAAFIVNPAMIVPIMIVTISLILLVGSYPIMMRMNFSLTKKEVV